jgi:hypothetical protein
MNKSYKWEQIKLKAQQIASDRLGNSLCGESLSMRIAVLMDAMAANPPKLPREEDFSKARECVWGIIAAWDVRMCAKLRNVFPEAFPMAIRTGTLRAYEADDADGTWYITTA